MVRPRHPVGLTPGHFQADFKIMRLGHAASRPSADVFLWDSKLASYVDVAQRTGTNSANRWDWNIEGHTGQWSSIDPQVLSIYAERRIILSRLPSVWWHRLLSVYNGSAKVLLQSVHCRNRKHRCLLDFVEILSEMTFQSDPTEWLGLIVILLTVLFVAAVLWEILN